jgi:RND family efflux transporter MFP subunit
VISDIRLIPCRKNFMKTTLTLMAAASFVNAAFAQSTSSARGLDCMIQPHQIVQIGSAAAGVIEHILVDRGDLVTRGQTIVQLQSGVERAALAVARERAQQQGEMTVAAGSADLAQRELKRAQELHEQNFVSQTYLDKQRAEVQVAGGRTDQANERKKLSQREVELAAAQLSQRNINAPITGVVVERFMSPGEFVDQKPILRIAAIDPLRVDVLVPAAAFGQVEVGMKGAVMPELLQKREHIAVVKTVDRVIDAATNTFRVRLELPNPGGTLPAGLRCKVDLGLKLPGSPMTAPASPAAAAVLPQALAPVLARN